MATVTFANDAPISSAGAGPLQKSLLMQIDPHHVPGYGGYCPQKKYMMGETFGRTTSRLLKADNVASSGNIVLADISQTKDSVDSKKRQERLEMLRTRKQSWGDQKLGTHLLPGYTGYIPCGQHYFGQPYSENCVKAISHFEKEQRRCKVKNNELHAIQHFQETGQNPTGQQLPKINMKKLIYKTTGDSMFIPKALARSSISPYYMRDDDPLKMRMSGCTCYVPGMHSHIGMGYATSSHQAFNEFTKESFRQKELASQLVQIHRETPKPVRQRQIYQEGSGMVPMYTGHIPGEKFRFGSTFGQSTKAP